MDINLQNYPYPYLAVATGIVLYTKWKLRRHKLDEKIKQYSACKLEILNYKRRKKKIKITIQVGQSIDDVNNALNAISELEDFQINTVTRIGHRKYLLEQKRLPDKVDRNLKGDITKIPIAQNIEGITYYFKLFETATLGLFMPSGSGKTTFALAIIFKIIEVFSKHKKTELILTIIDYKRGVDFQVLIRKRLPKNIKVRIIPADNLDAILEYIDELDQFYKSNMEQRLIENVDHDYKLKNNKVHHIGIWDELEQYASLKGVVDKEERNKISKIIKFCDKTSAVHRSNSINSIFITQSSKVSDLSIKLTNINLLIFSRISKEQADYFSIGRNLLKHDLGKGVFLIKDGTKTDIVRGIFIGTNEELMKK